jgi:hypothetical protein
MARYNKVIDECNVAIAASSTFLGLGIVAIIVGAVLVVTGVGAPLGTIIAGGGVVVSGVSGGVLGMYLARKEEAESGYKKAVVEFETAQTQCAILQALRQFYLFRGS